MTFRLLPYDYLDAKQYSPDSTWILDLDDDSTATKTGITNLTLDSSLQRRYTSFKYIKEAKDPVSGKGGSKIRFRQIRPKDRLREESDMQIQGWVDGPNANELMSRLNLYSKMPNLVVRCITDQIKTYAGYFGYDTDGPTLPTMDNDTDFYAGVWGSENTGNAVLDTDDYVEGTGSIKYYEASPVASTMYSIKYNPSSVINLEWADPDPDEPFDYLHFWYKNSRSSDAYSTTQFEIWDTNTDWMTWELEWKANTWTEIEIAYGDRFLRQIGEVDMSIIDFMRISTDQYAGDTTPFTARIDYFEVYMDTDGPPPGKFRKLEIPFYAIEGCQIQKRGGTGCRYNYTLRLKRIRDPPR